MGTPIQATYKKVNEMVKSSLGILTLGADDDGSTVVDLVGGGSEEGDI